MATFCPDLASAEGSGLEKFIAAQQIADGSVYVWNDIDDRSKGYTALATIPNYRAWSADQVEAAVRRVQNPTTEAPDPSGGIEEVPGKYSDLPEQLEIARRFGKIMEADPVIADDEYRSASELPYPPTRIAVAVCLAAVSQSLPKSLAHEVLRTLSRYLPSLDHRVLGPVAAFSAAVLSNQARLHALGPSTDTRGRSREELAAIAASMDSTTKAELTAVLKDIGDAAKGADVAVLQKCKQESGTTLETYKTLYRHLEEEWLADGKARHGAHGASAPTQAAEHRQAKSGCLLSVLAMIGAVVLGILVTR